MRHDSFRDPAFVELVRTRGVAIVAAGDSDFPLIADAAAPFVYARIMGTREPEPRGYSDAELETWAKRARAWAAGDAAADLPVLAPHTKTAAREVFLYVISGFKPLNPLAAIALIDKLK